MAGRGDSGGHVDKGPTVLKVQMWPHNMRRCHLKAVSGGDRDNCHPIWGRLAQATQWPYNMTGPQDTMANSVI